MTTAKLLILELKTGVVHCRELQVFPDNQAERDVLALDARFADSEPLGSRYQLDGSRAAFVGRMPVIAPFKVHWQGRKWRANVLVGAAERFSVSGGE